MKKVVERERNKTYYRILHLPIWVWVFFVFPGHLTYALYLQGPDRRHWIWLGVVVAVCAWRGFAGRLPGVEPRPYITHYGLDEPNLPYRVVCYTAAWVDLLVPFALNLIGLIIAAATGSWLIRELYERLYYPLALAVVAATWLDWTPRARRSTVNEGFEKAWFYVGIWTVVPAQIAAWAAWRLGGRLGMEGIALGRLRFGVFALFAAAAFLLGLRGQLPRTERYRVSPATEPYNALLGDTEQD
jgi:hypothetical protein